MAKVVICVFLASLLAFCRSAPVGFHGGSDAHCPLTVKILDALKGTPAGNVALNVYRRGQGGTWEKIASGKADASGEVHDLITEQEFTPGVYRVEFDTKAYWKAEGLTPFHEIADHKVVMAQVYFRCHSRATPTSLSHFGPTRGPDQSATSSSGAKRTQTHRLRHTQNPVEGVLALAAAKPDRTPGLSATS
ncbi:Transthyretin Prealbumin TBPA [Triplophysa tibetana]|uniref:Transthyretin n=1 Tax=Triplophysa tibetana TaxID=1572043 RepID=A0A5A9NIU2_9TELE|nr:Transthyretin Prealbumin TBPA [Triplophysa tibetana]